MKNTSLCAHLSLVVYWQWHWRRSIAVAPPAVAPPAAAGQLLAGLWKRREGGGSEGRGRQQISVTSGKGGELWLMWWLLLRLKCWIFTLVSLGEGLIRTSGAILKMFDCINVASFIGFLCLINSYPHTGEGHVQWKSLLFHRLKCQQKQLYTIQVKNTNQAKSKATKWANQNNHKAEVGNI